MGGSFENSDGTGTRLSHVYQLTGFADPVYAEAYVTVHDYDILLEILIINRTAATLTNLTVELATMGDLKLVERPLSLTIGLLINDQSVPISRFLQRKPATYLAPLYTK